MRDHQSTMFHRKTLIVDGLLTPVGSSRFDPLSFRLNDEAKLQRLRARMASLFALAL